MKKKIWATLIMLILITSCQNPDVENKEAYPASDIRAVIPWGAGGGTDNLMRPLAALSEKEIKANIIVQNMPGAAGAIATQYVFDQKADGYTLLMGAENPQLYAALKLSNLSYENFEPLLLVGEEKIVLVVKKGSDISSLKVLVERAKASPDQLKLATTGIGGMPWTMASFLQGITGASFNQIPYDSDAAALHAVLGGHADATFCKLQLGMDANQAGEIVFLSLFAAEQDARLKDVPLITDDYPQFAEYLPWGPFYGVFAKIDTPEQVLEELRRIFRRAYEQESYQELLKRNGLTPLGLSGSEAKQYLEQWKKKTLKGLMKAGVLENTP